MPKKRRSKAKVFVSDRKLATPRYIVGVQKNKRKIALKGYSSKSRAQAKARSLKKTGLVV